MKELDIVKAKRRFTPESPYYYAVTNLEPEEANVEAGEMGVIVYQYAKVNVYCVEFSGERTGTIQIDCTEDDIELVEEFKG
ncbi:MAG: hypothetical protein PHN64_03845 [Desulfovibrionaceae bacterium]|nr:hypothetical protein [Desulfovibrionaceae bacterium]